MLTDRRFGDYILLKRLAVGGQSEVYFAVKRGPMNFAKPLVLKALPARYTQQSQHLDMFYREAFVSARFAHPNVITVHDTKFIEGQHVMVMDFVSGQTVSDIAQRGYQAERPPALAHVVQMIADACEGLSYVHQFRDLDDAHYAIVHCDISPQNIMVTYQGSTKVFDFGIARVTGVESETEVAGGGKYAYMSPEQCMGLAMDGRSDIFSLGIILYELATGQRLFRRASKIEAIRAVTEEPIIPPREINPELPQAINDAVMRALERDLSLRYQSASQMRDDLSAWLASARPGVDLRSEFGNYVAGLFEDERREVANILLAASAAAAEAGQVDSSLHADGSLHATQPAPAPAGPSPEERAREEADRRKWMTTVRQAEERASELADEVDALKRQQTRLYATIAAVILVALLVVAFVHVRAQNGARTAALRAPAAMMDLAKASR